MDRIHWRDAVVPERTNTYTPIKHSRLINYVDYELEMNGYEVTSTIVDQNQKGTQIVATMTLKKGDADANMTRMFAIANSYDKTMPVRFAGGAHVYICGNGMVVGDIVTMRRHTKNVWDDLHDLLQLAIDKFEDDWKRSVTDVQKMSSLILTSQERSELIGRLFLDEEVLSSTEVNVVSRQIKNPSFEYGDSDRQSMWWLYNHITYALKLASPRRKLIALKLIHDFLMSYTNDQLTLNKEI